MRTLILAAALLNLPGPASVKPIGKPWEAELARRGEENKRRQAEEEEAARQPRMSDFSPRRFSGMLESPDTVQKGLQTRGQVYGDA